MYNLFSSSVVEFRILNVFFLGKKNGIRDCDKNCTGCGILGIKTPLPDPR